MSTCIFETKTFERSYKGIEFTVKLHFEEEYNSISDTFDYTEEELKEIYDKLDRYEIVNACAYSNQYINII